jgi:DNA-binding response OmpR family regulator
MNPHVLLVDDSLAVRMDLRAALTGAGFILKTCSTIESARAEIFSHAFDLVILDNLLPDGSGIDLLRQIKETPELRSIRVIMLSTEAEVRSRIQGLRLGADHYVGKPYDRANVVRTARELFQLPDVSGPSAARRSRKKLLLLLDGSPTFINSLALTLRQDGYEVVVSSSAQDAIVLLAVEDFDMVLMDLSLPGMDGVQTCRRLRSIRRMDSCLIVLMTTSEPDPTTRQDALAAGADELIFRPTRLSVLSAQLLCIFIVKRHQLRLGSEGPEQGLADHDLASARQGESLYERVIAASGLSEVLAKSLINSSFFRVGIDPTISAQITPMNLQRALSSISQTLRVFLPPEESVQRMASIAALAQGAYAKTP